MAITFIYPVKTTGLVSLGYIKEAKEVEIVRKDEGQDSLSYTMRDKKGNVYRLSGDYLEKMIKHITYGENGEVIFHTISTSLNGSGNYEEWEVVRKQLNPSKGNSGNLQYCIVQNFGIDLNPEVANEIGVKFAKQYLADYQCVVSTHINTGYVHNHIEFNATSFISGKKFNDNFKAIAEIRKISDKLCKEYELEVLEATKEFHYVRYKDSNGKFKIYEPTKRKNEKKLGEFSNKNDYRNTATYLERVDNDQTKKTHLQILKQDIDNYLPFVASYEELLEHLRLLGYQIKDKTKKGAWRKHISFKYPSWESYTRDSALGSNYLRKNLIDIISGYAVLDQGLRKCILEDIARNARQLSIPMEVLMTSEHKYILPEADPDRRKQYLLKRIHSNLKSVKFIEKNGIRNFQQLEEGMRVLYLKHNVCYNKLVEVKGYLTKLRGVMGIIQEYRNSENETQAKAIASMLKKLNMEDVDKQNLLQERSHCLEEQFKCLLSSLELITNSIREYNACVSCISIIDQESGIYKKSIESYYTKEKEVKNICQIDVKDKECSR